MPTNACAVKWIKKRLVLRKGSGNIYQSTNIDVIQFMFTLQTVIIILLLTVSRSVRLGLEPLIVTHDHILAWKKILVLSFVGRPP